MDKYKNVAEFSKIKKYIRLYNTLEIKKMTKRILKGQVVSDKNNKTIVVEVKRRFKHPFMEK